MSRATSVAVVTVTRNDLDGLKRTCQSVREQTHPDVRPCIVDGASTDGTLAFLESLPDGVDWISEPDTGIYNAMNKGLARVDAEYVLFLNAGDIFWRADALESLLAETDRAAGEATILSGRVEFTYAGRPTGVFRPPEPGPEGPGLPHQATLVRTDIHAHYPFDESLRFVGDYELWRRMRRNDDYRVAYGSTVMAYFDVGGASMNPRHDKERFVERGFVEVRERGRIGARTFYGLFVKAALRALAWRVLPARTFYLTAIRAGRAARRALLSRPPG